MIKEKKMKNNIIARDNSTENRLSKYYSTGYDSTGNGSTGDFSTGHYSTGDYSTGYYSTGEYSTGDGSTGDYSTGSKSEGDRSTGRFSKGNRSTGHCSISDYSTGHFSTIDKSGYGWFDKPCELDWYDVDLPDFTGFYLTEWVRQKDMMDEEKKNNPTYKATGGYLKTYTYEEAWANFWSKTSEENKQKFYNLPNFDAKVFKKITGIDVSIEVNKKLVEEYLVINGKKYKLVEEG